MQLTQATRTGLQQYSTALAKSYDVDNVGKMFAIQGPQETRLKNALLNAVHFLQLITLEDVDQIKGQVVSVGGNAIATGRKKKGRFSSKQSVDGNTYELIETDSVSETSWELLSVWINSGSTNEFMRRLSQNTTLRFALDILRIGFNGTSAAVDTDPEAFPMGEDVNKGWHQLVKEIAPEQIVTSPIVFDPNGGGDYKTLDAMAVELKNSLIHESLRTDPRLVVLVGSDLVASSQTHMLNAADKPTEQVAAMKMDKNIGGMHAYTPPFFPSKRMVVTTLSNLHCYTQRGTRQRSAENIDDRKQWEEKYWRMEGYAIEEFESYAAIDESAMTIAE